MCPTQTEIILLWFVVKDGVVMDRNERFDVIEVGKRLRFENQTSRSPKNKPLEVGKRESNNTKINNTEYSKTNPILSKEEADKEEKRKLKLKQTLKKGPKAEDKK